MIQHSIYRAAREAADTYRKSVGTPGQPGALPADAAETEWNRDHWGPWASDMVVRHVTGDVCWNEIGAGTFASVSAETPDRLRMIERIQAIRAELGREDLIPYARRRELIDEWTGIINGLLDS